MYVYIVTGQGAISALNAADGTLRWCDLEGSALTMPSVPATPALVVDQDMLYLSGGTTVVLALNASDGTQQWKKQAQGTPVVLAAVDGQVYVQVCRVMARLTLSVLDASTGNERLASPAGYLPAYRCRWPLAMEWSTSSQW